MNAAPPPLPGPPDMPPWSESDLAALKDLRLTQVPLRTRQEIELDELRAEVQRRRVAAVQAEIWQEDVVERAVRDRRRDWRFAVFTLLFWPVVLMLGWLLNWSPRDELAGMWLALAFVTAGLLAAVPWVCGERFSWERWGGALGVWALGTLVVALLTMTFSVVFTAVFSEGSSEWLPRRQFDFLRLFRTLAMALPTAAVTWWEVYRPRSD